MSKPSKSLGLLAASVIITGMTIIDYYKHPHKETLERMEIPAIQYETYFPSGRFK